MSDIRIESIQSRLQELPGEMVKEVSDFIDFLAARQKKTRGKKTPREKLLEVSTWGKKDIQIFQRIQKDMNRQAKNKSNSI